MNAADNILSAAIAAADAGLAVVWQNGKRAVAPGWNKGPAATAEHLHNTYRVGHNVAFRAGPTSRIGGDAVVVLDVDLRSEDDADQSEARAAFTELVGGMVPTVRTGGGGAHLYLRMPADALPSAGSTILRQSGKRMPSDDPSKPGRPAWTIELLAAEHAVTMPPSIHPSGQPYQWVNGGLSHVEVAPESLLRALATVGIEKTVSGVAVAVSAVSAVEPEPFEDDTPPTPWPDDCLPPGMEGAARAIAEHVKAPKAMAALSVLAAVAHVAMRLVDADHPKAGAIPCSLFTLVAGQSGDRKTQCFKLATWPVSKREREIRNRHKAETLEIEQRAAKAKPSERQAIKAAIPPDPRTIFVDATTQKIEHVFVRGSAPALSLSTDEGGTLLGGHSLKSETRAASLSALTRLFDGGGVQRDRIGEDQSGFRFDIRFGLFLLAQPVVLVEALDDPLMRDQGFLPRFIYAAPNSLAGTRFETEADLDRRASDDFRVLRYWDTLRALDEIAPTLNEIGDLRLSPAGWTHEAKQAWLRYYCRTEARQGVDGDMHHLRAFAGRAGELVVRVATVYAVWRSTGGIATVEAEDVERAGLLVDYSLAEWLRQSGPCLTPAERDARDLLALIHRKGWATVSRVLLGQYAPNALRKSSRRRNDAIETLLGRGWLLPGDGGNLHIQNSKNSKKSDSNPPKEVFIPEPQGNLEAFDL